MALAQIERHQVLGALKATGSSDADVLFARKEELLAETRRMELVGIASIVVGGLISLTIVGAVVGVPAILFGRSIRKQIRANVENAESIYAEFVALVARPRASVSARGV